MNNKSALQTGIEADISEWLEALENIRDSYGDAGVRALLDDLNDWSSKHNVPLPESSFNSPYLNTIPASSEPDYPGDIDLEQSIENILRWNAMAMVLRGQDSGSGVGGHIATYASAATMMEVGFNHFFRKRSESYGGDLIIPQPHTSPGVYARSWLEGRFETTHLNNYRRELQTDEGLTSYPHPRSMPDYWQVANASMGLSTPTAIYQARFAKYLENRGLKAKKGGKVWCFIGDGETDEPEVLGTINIAAREKLDNLILVVNCNLQRLDGPVRGNGKIIQELESSFKGSGWNVIKVIWGSGWDKLLDEDHNAKLRDRMEECVDGDYQRFSVLPGESQREHWVDGSPELEAMMNSLNDEEVKQIKRGGQDVRKIYAAFDAAAKCSDKPTVVLVKTVKGDGIVGAQGSNTVHQKKNLDGDQRLLIARNFGIPLDEEAIRRAEFYKPDDDSAEIKYLKARREALGGPIPEREQKCPALSPPPLDSFKTLIDGAGGRPQSTTMSLVRILSVLLRDKSLNKYIVPIVPDEARTFGLEALFKIAGIFSLQGQQYTPVDADTLLAYREAEDGQILQEGICETGALASFLAAGTAYSIHGLPMIPFYFFYSIFGFQRVGDMIWTCGDMLCRGFLIGGTAGRTTLNGEGIQHQDGHSQIIASTYPSLKSYDPAFAYELVVIVREGIRRMYEQQENIFYYITAYNENYLMPAMPSGKQVEGAIVAGGYLLSSTKRERDSEIHLLGSGSIMQQVLNARDILEEKGFNVSVWSITSYNELLRDAEECERENRLHPFKKAATPYVEKMFDNTSGSYVAVSDYMKSLASSIAPWMLGHFTALGTDGYGLSESRADLRDYFEISPDYICQAAMVGLMKLGKLDATQLRKHLKGLNIDPDKANPMHH
ncbi:MAG: pyruvate dehydrogenase (acetyl-transferring), homodimeric type [SAR86 cluster bacterium]|uniref:Pyruvate dehydrogenase E1 component n=1 Tax=SAR86 cluster bacterium TaxID=2030880 RepID=A0A2A4WZY7_9GAMM|nr:MAG: pyruvate dehydrogenase (acetyl-transferring), homodimeric type [SAR86 cluster bacterium]